MRKHLVMRGTALCLVPIVLVVGGLGAGSASAHSALVGSDPEDGSTHATAPTTITLTFNENVGATSQIAVQAPDGSQLEVTGLRAVDHRVTASVVGADQRGRYSASYRVVSADGHPVTGTIAYDVTTGRSVEQVAGPEQSTFLHRHRSHLIWGVLAAVLAIALLLAPLRRRDDRDSA